MKVLFAFLLTGSLLAAEDRRVEYALGVRDEGRGDEAGAYDHFEKALSLDRKSLPLVEKMVGLKLAAGDHAGAVKLMRELAKAWPERVEVQLEYVSILQREGQGDAAVKVLEKLPKLDLRVVQQLLTLYRERGDAQRAVNLMEWLPEENAAAAEIYASTSQALFESSDLEARARVDERYEKALLANPKDPELARGASEYFRTTGRLDDAILILQKHAAAAPWTLDLRTRLGVLLFSAKRDADGEAALKAVVAIRPASPLAHQALAKFYRLKGDGKSAREHGAELLKIRGGSAREFMLLADEFLAAGEPREARLLLEKGVFNFPDQPELAMKLAVATRRDPETQAQAARLFREAEAAMGADFKPDAAFLIESAETMIEQGQSKAAEERLRTAIKSYPPDQKRETAAALRRLAALWESENRNAEAARALRQRAEALEK